MKTVGSRAEVWHGTAKKTSGGLLKKDLKKNKRGRIVSKKMSNRAKKEKRLEKAGYKTKKGVFKKFKAKKRGGENSNNNETNKARGNAAKMFQNAENNYLKEELLYAIYDEKIKKINSLLIEVNKLNIGIKKKILKGLLDYAINAKIEDAINDWKTALNYSNRSAVNYDNSTPGFPSIENYQKANDANEELNEFENIIINMKPNEDIINILLTNGIDINEVDEDGNTALINATQNLYFPAVEMLLIKGADPTISNNESMTAIDYVDLHTCKYPPHPGYCDKIRELLTLPAAAPAAGGSKKRRNRKTTKRKSKK